MQKIEAHQLKPGDLFRGFVYKKTNEFYPTCPDPTKISFLTFLGFCSDLNCVMCHHQQNTSGHYVFVKTIEDGHIKMLDCWHFPVANR